MAGKSTHFTTLVGLGAVVLGLVLGMGVRGTDMPPLDAIAPPASAPVGRPAPMEGRALAQGPSSRESMGRALVEEVSEITKGLEDPGTKQTDELAFNLAELSGQAIAKLSDEELAPIPMRTISDEAILRAKNSTAFLFSHKALNEEAFQELWGELPGFQEVSEDSLELAKDEIVRMHAKLVEIREDEKLSPDYISPIQSSASRAMNRRYLASYCAYIARIDHRAEPFMIRSERVVLALLQVTDPDAKLFK